MTNIFEKYAYDTETKLRNFEKYVDRQSLARFLARYELFRRIIGIKGSIVECGVHYGGGLLAWGKLSSALEPYALHRKVIGFDTFEGFPGVSDKDTQGSLDNEQLRPGGLSFAEPIYDEIMECIEHYNENRFLNQFPKFDVVRGDATKTIPEYVAANQHLVVSLLLLDFDLYEPTKAALDHLLPRVPKGGIVAFDEINNASWPGETTAVMEKFTSLNGLHIEKFPFDPNIAYVVI